MLRVDTFTDPTFRAVPPTELKYKSVTSDLSLQQLERLLTVLSVKKLKIFHFLEASQAHLAKSSSTNFPF